MTAANIAEENDFAQNSASASQRIKVVGVGGGGNNAVNHMFNQGINDVSFVLINTDRQVLDQSNVPTRLVIGPGLGAGGKPEKAEKFAEENAEKIAELFDDNTDMVFVTAGMGGGTGTGAGPVVARIAKEKGILTVGIVTIPFFFEGRRKVLKALEGAKKMEENVDAVLIINNERLTEIYKDFSILNAFSKADDTLLTAAKGITEIITRTGRINRDFNDVDTTLRSGGAAIISTGWGQGENRVTDAIQDALNSPLLRNTDIFSSKKLLMVLYISDNEEQYPFNMSEAQQLTDFVNSIDDDVDVMWGLYPVPELDDRVKITILASGFNVTVDKNEDEPTPVLKPIDPQRKKEEDQILINEYGENVVRTPRNTKVRVLKPEEMDSDEAISDAAGTATYERMRRSGGLGQNRAASQNRQQAPDANRSQGSQIDFSDLDD